MIYIKLFPIDYGVLKMPRLIEFFDGQQSPVAPDLSTLSRLVTGSEGTPIDITAAGGISIQDVPDELIFIVGDGGPIDITANPQIQAGSMVGQQLTLVGTSEVNTVLLEDGDGVTLNGAWLARLENNITLFWTGTVWKELNRF